MASPDLFAPPSTEEIKALQKAPAQGADLFAAPSEHELKSLQSIQQQAPGLLEKYVVPVGRFVDRYTGAPTRSAVGAMTDGHNPVSAFMGQFGEDPEQAPTGKEIAQKWGVSDRPVSDFLPSLYNDRGPTSVTSQNGFYAQAKGGSPDDLLPSKNPGPREGFGPAKGGLLDPSLSGAAGLGVDLAADWTNVIPASMAAKSAYRGAKAGAEGLGKAALAMGRGAAEAGDVITGTKAATKMADTTSQLAERTKSAIDKIFNAKRADNFQETAQIAQKHGIDPALLSSSIEFGPHSTISRLERVLREGPTGEKMLEQYQKGYQAISDAVDNTTARVAGGVPKNAYQAGELMRDSFDQARDKLFGSMDITYKKVQKYAPGLYVDQGEAAAINSKLSGMEKWAKGQMQRGFTAADREQGKQVLRAVQAVQSTNGSYKQLVETMQQVGKTAFSSKPVLGQVPPDVKKFKDLYFTLQDAAINTIDKHVNPEFAKELRVNNKTMSDFFSHQAIVGAQLKNDATASENLFKSLVLNGDSKKIESLKQLLPAQDVQQLKGAFLNELVKRDADGNIIFKSTANALRQRRNQAAALFEPEELQDLVDLMKVGHDYGPAIMSSSGTGASAAFSGHGGGFARGIVRGLGGEKYMDYLKAKARGGPQGLLDSPPGLLKSASEATPEVLAPVPVRPSRGPREGLLKGMQTVAPSHYRTQGSK